MTLEIDSEGILVSPEEEVPSQKEVSLYKESILKDSGSIK